jgi:hypothetical protein
MILKWFGEVSGEGLKNVKVLLELLISMVVCG